MTKIFTKKKIMITGGLGFIGSNITKHLLNNNFKGDIILFDNNSINNQDSINYFSDYKNVYIVFGDMQIENIVEDSLIGVDLVIHLCANSDISKGVENPKIDFQNTVVTTHNLLCGMLKNNVKDIIFSSGSGIYGDLPNISITENNGPNLPISHYGASKLCAEAMISSFVFMHDFNALIFRFANVVGEGQTHGVAYDFIKKLKKEKNSLEIKGNGRQLKSYIHISDIINGIEICFDNFISGIDHYNISTDDTITVKDIAISVLNKMNLNNANLNFGETDYGWKGDVPVILLSNNKIKSIGWNPKYNSIESINIAIDWMIKNLNN